MSIIEMRNYLRSKYNGKYNGRSVDEMADRQVFAIYYALTNREKKTVGKVDKDNNNNPNQQNSRILSSDDKSSVIDTDTDEFFTREEWEKMNA